MKQNAARVFTHAAAFSLFAVLTIAWTWPLAAHLTQAIPGLPGDNYSFLWDLWWMRRVRALPALQYFQTNYLFYPFGTSLVNHPHVALPAFVSATVLHSLTIVTAHNVVLLTFVFSNMACAYALAFDVTRHVRASILAALVYGLSPYFAAHIQGHFDLMAGWVLPAYVLLLRRALWRRSWVAAASAGLVAIAAAYTTYYYVVYLGLLTIVFIAVRLRPVKVTSPPSTIGTSRRLEKVLLAAAIVAASLAVAVAIGGGTSITLAGRTISMRQPQNILSATWILAAAWALARWRPQIRFRRLRRETLITVAVVSAIIGAVFLAGAAPLLVRARQVAAHGDYASQTFFWRSIPLGVDLAAPLLGPPRHPLSGNVSRRAYAALGLDAIEAVGWIGVVTPLLLVLTRRGRVNRRERRCWWSVAVVFALLALGPLLKVGGFDTGMRLPSILLRYVPLVADARMPGRGMVGLFLALGILIGLGLSRVRGPLARPGVQFAAIGLVAFEMWDAPILLTPLAPPAALQTLAAESDGAVCAVPFGIGDGLSTGVGWQERRVLYDATVHEHPLVGGFIGRLAPTVVQRYEEMPVVGALLRLSDGRSAPTDPSPADVASSPCRYLIVDRKAVTPALREFVHQLPVDMIAASDDREVYRLRDK
ncbi:MAG TPA: hypothetical protein VH583_13705 [Vicinamibacterales bacterium]